MAFVATDIGVNEFGRFRMASGADNVFQKVDKVIRTRLAAFVGQKSSLPVGTVLGAIRLIDLSKEDYIFLQDQALNRELYESDDIVSDIDKIEIKVGRDGNLEFSLRIVTPAGAITVTGTVAT